MRVSDAEWFEVRRLPDGVTMIREPHHSEDVKVYLIEGERDVAVLDTGMGVGDFAGLVGSLTEKRPVVLQTHAHWDHIGSSHRFTDVRVHPSEAEGLRAGTPEARYRAAFSGDEVDASRLPADFDTSGGLPGCEPTGWLEHGDRIDLGGRVLEVLHTPGHSPGGVLFLDRQARALFVGDLLYLGRIYVFLATSDPAAFRRSMQLAGDVSGEVEIVYPAHGPAPITPADILTIRDAYEEVWDGRSADRPGALFGFDLEIHDFGRFSFLMPAGDWRAAYGAKSPQSGRTVRTP
jgi:glyoxylase-like metal-dependent hydrolase (beta-lactamase superfamily II)